MLLGLARGSGGRGRSPGCAARFDRYRRPLLGVGRDDTVGRLPAEGIPIWDDPHNPTPASPAPGCAAPCCRCSRRELGPGVGADAGPHRRPAARRRGRSSTTSPTGLTPPLATSRRALAVEALAGLPDAVRTRVLRLAALAAGRPAAELFHVHVPPSTPW